MTVVVVDDHPVIAEALTVALREAGLGSVDAITGPDIALDEVLARVTSAGPGTLAVLDLHLGDAGPSTPLIGPLCEAGARVLVLTAEQDPRSLGECLEAGADGVFDKAQPFDQLIDLIRDAALGRSVMSTTARATLLTGLTRSRREDARRRAPFEQLTDRERSVLTDLMGGLGVDAIAQRDVVAVSTIRSHVKGVLRKLGVNSQLAAVALAREAGWPTEGERD